jgi:hypothetical protein
MHQKRSKNHEDEIVPEVNLALKEQTLNLSMTTAASLSVPVAYPCHAV